jgi:hypothetical protein
LKRPCPDRIIFSAARRFVCSTFQAPRFARARRGTFKVGSIGNAPRKLAARPGAPFNPLARRGNFPARFLGVLHRSINKTGTLYKFPITL